MEPPHIENDTDFRVHPQLLCDRDAEKLSTVVKATFELAADGKLRGADGSFQIAPKPRRRGVRAADIAWGKPEKSSIRYPSDLCLRKPGAELVVLAVASAPGDKPVPTFDAGVRLGKLSKILRVHGPRVWLPDGDGVSASRPFTSLEVRWEQAFGGSDDADPERYVEDPRNPLGLGVMRDLSLLGGTPAPRIEDVAIPIKNAADKPEPAGLSPLGRHWLPRRSFWGTYDRAWLDDRAPLLPADFDDRANFSAPAALVSKTPFAGGEEGALMNLVPGGGTVDFVLPKIALELTFEGKDRAPEVVRPPIDTILFDALPNDSGVKLTVELVWRAFVQAPRKQKDTLVRVKELRG
jgi:hypothetical protein